MFVTGDRVVYPLHGGAIVEDIQDRDQDGNIVKYYVLQMIFDSMVISVPVSNAEKLGLRSIGDKNTLLKIKNALNIEQDIQSVKSISWNKRFHLYMESIKSGSVVKVAQIFKILTMLDKCKKISVGERRLLHSTKQILQSEIMLISNVDADKASAWLDKCCE